MLNTAPIAPTIPTTDLQRSKDFYEKTLGLKLLTETKDDLMFQAGGNTKLYIYQRGPSKAEHTLAAFQVDDLEAAIDELTQKGVKFEQYDFPGMKTNEKGIAMMDGEKAAWFKDPDGNILGVGEFKK